MVCRMLSGQHLIVDVFLRRLEPLIYNIFFQGIPHHRLNGHRCDGWLSRPPPFESFLDNPKLSAHVRHVLVDSTDYLQFQETLAQFPNVESALLWRGWVPEGPSGPVGPWVDLFKQLNLRRLVTLQPLFRHVALHGPANGCLDPFKMLTHLYLVFPLTMQDDWPMCLKSCPRLTHLSFDLPSLVIVRQSLDECPTLTLLCIESHARLQTPAAWLDDWPSDLLDLVDDRVVPTIGLSVSEMLGNFDVTSRGREGYWEAAEVAQVGGIGRRLKDKPFTPKRNCYINARGVY